jgi:HEAT repeat protein
LPVWNVLSASVRPIASSSTVSHKPGHEALRKHLASTDAKLRAAACLAVVQYGGKLLRPILIELVENEQPLVAGPPSTPSMP